MTEALALEPLQCEGERLPAHSTWVLLKDIAKIAVPSAAGCVFSMVTELTNTLVIGRTGGDAELAAIGLANMMQNCFGLSIGIGVCAALDTLASQAFGAGEHVLCCHHFQRCRVLVTLQLFWMVPLLWNSESLLLFVHQDPDVAYHAGTYNRASVWGLFAAFQTEATRRFLQNRQCTLAPAVAGMITSLLHIGWCIFFVVHLGLGNAGAGYANAVTWWTGFLLSQFYLLWYSEQAGLERRAVVWIQKPGLARLREYLRIAVPATVQLGGEWWFWEICALVVGYLGSVALAAHVAALQLITVIFMLVIGLNTACATLVGNAIGANRPQHARRTAWMCVLVNIGLWLLIGVFLFKTRARLATLLTRDPKVQPVVQNLFAIYVVAGLFDTTQNIMGAALRGLGLQMTAATVYCIAFYLIMLPAGCIFAFSFGLGVYGIWWSMALGTSIATVIFTLVLCRTRFAELAARASAEVAKQGQATRGSSVDSTELAG